MKCPKCHTVNPAGAKECDQCGVQFADIRKPEQPGISAWKVHEAGDIADRLQWLETPDREGRYAKPKTLVNSRCAWNDHGYRCEVAGSLSDSTTGSGQWYCSVHYWQLKGRGIPPAAPAMRHREPGDDDEEIAA